MTELEDGQSLEIFCKNFYTIYLYKVNGINFLLTSNEKVVFGKLVDEQIESLTQEDRDIITPQGATEFLDMTTSISFAEFRQTCASLDDIRKQYCNFTKSA